MSNVKVIFDAGVSAVGDSITLGEGTYSPPTHGYMARLAAFIGGGLNNQAVSGTGTRVATNIVMNMYNKRRGLLVYMAGFNDVRRSGLSATSKITNSIRSAIACALLDKCEPASSLTRVGLWGAVGGAAGGRALGMGGNAMYTNDTSAYMEYKFRGTNVVVGSITTDLSNTVYQDLDIEIDGGSPILFEVSNRTNEAYGFVVKVIQGLPDGPHTIRVKPRGNTPWSVVDYIGTLADPGARGSVLISHIPMMTYWTMPGLDQANPTIVNQVNAEIDAVVAEFAGYPVAVVPVNDFYDPNNTLDGVHPNDSGHYQIYLAMLASCKMWC